MKRLGRLTSVSLVVLICAVLSLALVAPYGSFVFPKGTAAPEVKASVAIEKKDQAQPYQYILAESSSRAWLWPASGRSFGTATMQSLDGIAFRALTTANNGTGAISITVSTPAGTASGEVMVAGIYVRGAGSTSSVTGPSGWTLIRRTDLGSPTGSIGSVLSYFKVAGGAEPSNYTWTFDASRRALAGIASYAGADTAAPVDASDGQANSTGSTAVTAPSITTTVTNTMLVGLFCQFDFATFSPAGGMTERWDETVNNPAGMAFSAVDEARASVGVTGGRTATSSFSDSSVAQLIALRPGNVTPNAPSNLTGAAGNAQVSLSWTASSGAASYKVFRATLSGGYNYNVPLEGGITSTTYMDTTAVNGTPYYYVVRATNGVGDSASSNEVSATPSNSAFAVKINFQPASAEVPVGYLSDTGVVYGSRGNAYSYGWNADSSAHMRDRNAANSLDQRYDTLNHTQIYGAFTWEIAVPSGTYMVRLVAGDPNNTNSVFKFNVEGVLTVDGTASIASRWVEGTKTVTVSDGRLTVSNSAGAINNKVCFIEISSVTPLAPTNLSATAFSSSQINLGWTDNANNEDGLKIERCQGAGCTDFIQVAQVGANVAIYNDTGRTDNTTYFYRVRAFNSADDSGYSNTAQGTTLADPVPSAAPSNLTASAISSSQINLAWADNSNNENGFKVERKTGATGTYAEIATTSANAISYSDTTVSASSVYYYRVRAFNGVGASNHSAEANATTPAPPPPAAPSSLAATAASATQINLAWADNSGNESGFKVERCEGAGCAIFTEITQVGPSVTTYSDTGRAAATTYTYRVRAFNSSGDSSYSNTTAATTLVTPPAAPSNLTATAASASQINLSWTDNANNEDGFKIESCQGTGCSNFIQIGQIGFNPVTYNDTAKTANTTYLYRVRAFNSGGYSNYSGVVEATTPPPPPPAAPGNLAATAVSISQIDLLWTDNSTDESDFKIERCQGSGCTNFAQIAQVGAGVITFSNAVLVSRTTYVYRVRASNNGGDSEYSNTAEATTLAAPPPGAPSNLTAAAASASQINLTWTDNSNNENGFTVERCTGVACMDFAEITQTAENATTYNDTDRASSTTYRYRVRAFNGSGISAFSNTDNATTFPIPPAAPGNLAATAASSSQINLTWTDHGNNESGSKIERCQGATCMDFTQVGQVNADTTAYSDTGRTESTTYRYRVRAFNSGGDSGYSNTAEATTPAPPPPAAPSNLAAAAASSSSQINLTWTDNSTNENGFKVERCTGAACLDFTEITHTSENITSYSDTGRTSSTTYRYRVRAINSGGSSNYSNISEAATLATPPAAPGSLTATAASATQINLAWADNSSDESGFKIERCQDAGCMTFTEITQVGANVTGHSDTGRAASATYLYRVRAFNSGGDSSYSNTAEATPPPTPPTAPSGLVATATSASQIGLTWTDNASNEDGFKIERCQGTGCTTFAQIGLVGAGVTSFGNTGLSASSTYLYRIRAFNSGGDSGYSNTAEATTETAPVPPAAPSNLVSTAASSSQINLAWADNSNNDDGFRVERKTGTAGTYVEVGTVTTGVTTYQDTTGLAAGTQYFYRVRSYNVAGNSGYSNEASATTADTAPASPSGLVSSTASSSQVILAWADNSTNETGFKIERKTGVAETFAQIATVGSNVTTLSDTGLSATTQYIYRVRAYNTVGDSSYSNVADATTLGNAPAAPTGLSATAGNAEVTLSWTASSDATSYNVKRATVSGGPYTISASGVATTSYTDTTVNNGTTYNYVVSAANSFGESGDSTQASATPGTSPLGGIAFRASASASNGSGATTITINTPAGTASGDVMVAGIYVRGAGSTTSVSPPFGWTPLRRTDLGSPVGAIGSVLSYYKVAGGAEPANYTWTFDTSRRALGGIASYAGVDTAAPVDASGGQENGTGSTAVTAPSIMTTVANTRLVGLFCQFDFASFTPAAGMAERWDMTVNNPAGMAFSATDEVRASVGETSGRTATSSFSDSSVAQLIALRPTPVSCTAGNCPPNTPTITAPLTDLTIVHPADVHMETSPNFSDPNPGDTHVCTDWEIWTVSSPERVWVASCIDGPHRYHTHIGDGIFENSHAGRNDFLHDTDYRLRARYKDSSGNTGTQWSPWAERRFRTASPPPDPSGTNTWSVMQPGYQVEVFATGLELPVNIAFVPNPGPRPTDPYLYVTELYSGVKVVSRNGTVTDYLRNLLNYIPSGQFPGDGEQGITGIVVDPVSRDVFVSLLYDVNGVRHPIVVRLFSDSSGAAATGFTVVLDMVGETQYASHQISNLSIGPDGKLYVHNGDGFDVSTGQNLDSFRGKILRMNLNGSAPSDNPFYDASNGITARDYVYAYGFRNAFGGDWRKADNFHYAVENGPSVDRFAKIVRGRNYLWDGSDASMYNYAIYNWSPSTAPVNLAFVQPGTFGGSGFPAEKMGHAFVSESGPTWASGPVGIYGKRVSEFALDASGNLVSGPTTLVEYSGTGKATVSGLATGPDGLYFTDLYVDQNFETAVARGANILRIKYIGAVPAAPTGLSATAGNAQVSLSWTASLGATSYNVKRATVSGGPYTTISGIATTSYTDTTVSNGTTYHFVVTAVNSFGESGNSAQVSAAPSAVPPAGITFRASASASNGGGATTITVSKPSGTANGDLLLASIYVRGAGSTASVTSPSGWTLIRRDDDSAGVTGGVGSLVTYYRLAGNAEPASYTWSFDSTRRAMAGIVGYSGVASIAPTDASSGQTGFGTSVTAPSLNTSVNGAMLVGLFALFEGGQSFTPPLGMTERIDASDIGANLTLEITDERRSAAGATGARAALSPFSDSYLGQLIALKPAP